MRELVVKRRLIFSGEDRLCHYRMVKLIRLLLVKQFVTAPFELVLYLENDILYVSVNETFHGKLHDAFDSLIDKVVEDILMGSLIMKQNPMFTHSNKS